MKKYSVQKPGSSRSNLQYFMLEYCTAESDLKNNPDKTGPHHQQQRAIQKVTTSKTKVIHRKGSVKPIRAASKQHVPP